MEPADKLQARAHTTEHPEGEAAVQPISLVRIYLPVRLHKIPTSELSVEVEGESSNRRWWNAVG